ncbi:MAG TPA: YlxR family protein [Dehalococcoidia bacterium]|nr:YlxR family protein [Dehalococcoidia bacterium]
MSQHIPQRTCVACRQARPKRELIRLVRTADRGVEIDRRGKAAGRGAYLCHRPECWEAGLKSNRLEYALRATLSVQNREELWQQARDILEGDTKSGHNK